MARRTGDVRFAVQVMFTVLVLEVVGFAVSNSLALLADSFFVLTEILFLLVVLRGMKCRGVCTLSALFSLAVFIAGLSIMYLSVYRFVFGAEVRGAEMLVFGSLGVLLSAAAMRKVRKRYNLGMKGSALQVSRKSIPSLLVLSGGLWVAFTGEAFVDYSFAFAITLFIMLESIVLFRDSAFAMLGIPKAKTYLFKNVRI